MGAYYHDSEFTSDGKYKPISVRVDIEEILDELQRSIKHLKDNYNRIESKFKEVKSEKYTDTVIQSLKNEIKQLKDDYRDSFNITMEEKVRINDWQAKWFDKYNGGNRYLGAVGGGFIYSFQPTSIGVVGSITAPNGEKFIFRELD